MSLNNFIKIDYKLLPIVKNVKPEKFSDILWVTYSIETMLADYIITEDALLYVDHVNDKIEDSNHHGIIHFFSQNGDIKQQFKAKYTDGKLVSIIQVQKNDRHWSTKF